MAELRRRTKPVSQGGLRIRVFAATFGLFFVIFLVVAVVHG
ncbi:hypothetical protein JOE57_003662 [Microlunatus panaciterrae]|uniref:Uncharacterized protein n=1 Tax=Microlunatus panaciterrae TaxID=400768 RepID=A0ABS2RP03_9ACTN|nr:hypothetical protein [Microlunatus panaciterrae]MBM7800741.1 hypothetical protein [Microlunatus panaciterrae]